eukprot:gene8593-10573_t
MKVVDISQIPNPIILNVGGTCFTTSISTLTSVKNTYFDTMFSGAFSVKPMEGTKNTFFIDRDGEMNYPSDPNHKKELIKEINYFCLNEYIDSLRYKTLEHNNNVTPKLFETPNEYFEKINEWGKFSSNTQWKLLYQATVDGFEASTFHQKCDNQGPTVSIITSSNGNVFGGYTDTPWGSDISHDSENEDFFMDTSKGPYFGSDLVISDNSNTKFSSSYLGTYYKNPFESEILAELEKQSDKLKEEIEKRDNIMKVVDISQIPNPIILNVGGSCFTTSISTLTSVKKTYFDIMFSGNFSVKPMEGTKNTFFIDRDGTHFRYILNYLRDGELNYPSDPNHKKELIKEIKFYSLDDYINSEPKQTPEEKQRKEYFQKINEWGNLSPNQQWKLIYKATVDGFRSTTFHLKCVNKGATVSIITSSNGNVFGGYICTSWGKQNHLYDERSFLFLLSNGTDQFIKFPIKMPYYNNQNLQVSNQNLGPYFGPDLSISNNANTISSSSTLGHYFSSNNYEDTILAGSKNFLVTEIEVFSL